MGLPMTVMQFAYIAANLQKESYQVVNPNGKQIKHKSYVYTPNFITPTTSKGGMKQHDFYNSLTCDFFVQKGQDFQG